MVLMQGFPSYEQPKNASKPSKYESDTAEMFFFLL